MRFVLAIAVAAAALVSTGGVPAQVLEGDAAMGDYRDDAPGVTRLLRADDLAAPRPDESASNGPGYVARPEGALPQVADGFAVELVATGIDNPRAIRFAPDGDLFLANSGAGEVRRYRPGSGEPEESVFASGLNRPYGIAFFPAQAPEWVYIAVSNGLLRLPYTAKGAATAAPEYLFQDIPAGGHWKRDIAFSADGTTLYYSVGSGSNVGAGMNTPAAGVEAWAAEHPLGAAWGAEAGRATVLAMDPEGKNRRIYAAGLRNCAGMALQPATGLPWCVVNERDALGDNVPLDYATAMTEGQFFGWPWYYIGDNPDPRWSATPRDDLRSKVSLPDVLFQAHSAPLNIAFYDSDAWGEDYRGDAFVALHGSWNRGTRTGYKVVRLDFDADGQAAGTYEDFMTGFVLDDANAWGRPVGVAVAPDGSLYVTDDGSGSLWRVTRK